MTVKTERHTPECEDTEIAYYMAFGVFERTAAAYDKALAAYDRAWGAYQEAHAQCMKPGKKG